MVSHIPLPSAFRPTDSLIATLQHITLTSDVPSFESEETPSAARSDQAATQENTTEPTEAEVLAEEPLEDPFALLYEEDIPVTLSTMNDPAQVAPAGGTSGWLVGTGTAGSLFNSSLLVAGADYVRNLSLEDLVGYELTEEDIEALKLEAEELATEIQQDYDDFQDDFEWPDSDDLIDDIELPLVGDLLGGNLLGGLLGGVLGGVLDTVTDILI
ncbi:hypothetical protein [Celeribacter persicus]|jgi:hypothetical protein|uniref:Uncharacterized protein n=1 Tax=Celeribacter persicus TaxID=1651082 RepID=A0A2T5HIP1_9RHOB|nr:hypothetical protein [Celeribacter persicus]PTQ71409.1 hypothetical protein C8N42_108187 [Celeribacter persicus]